MNSYTRKALLAYGLFGLPLSLVALPVYVYIPQLYATQFGLSLGLIGIILLLARLADACIDPLLGLWIDRRKAQHGYAGFILIALPLLLFGFIGLFYPPSVNIGLLLTWFAISLMLVYLGYSMASIAHGSWGANLTQQRGQRARLTAMREGCALAGVLLAAAVPALLGLSWLCGLFVVALVVGAWSLLRIAPRPTNTHTAAFVWSDLFVPFHHTTFRWLLLVFAVNGIAAAIPATLFLFFATDRLQLAQYSGLFLVLYFLAAACALPLWVAAAARIGEAYAWLLSMIIAIVVFIWAFTLPAGSVVGFAVICMLSGVALGADLALPPALLAGAIGKAGHEGRHEGAYFGLWSWATKMNLALAAGTVLPMLDRLGYTPGTSDVQGLTALGIAYAIAPCMLKIIAALLLWRSPLKNL